MINLDTAKEYVENVALKAMGLTDVDEKAKDSLALNFYLTIDYLMRYGQFNLSGIPVQKSINFSNQIAEPSDVVGMTFTGKKTGFLS